jgi:hypothetical protein
MVNDLRPPGAGRRVLGPELRDVLLAHPCVIGWVNGHTHVHAIQAVREDGATHRLTSCPRAPGATTGGSAAPAT